jgi:hypothetical protein
MRFFVGTTRLTYLSNGNQDGVGKGRQSHDNEEYDAVTIQYNDSAIAAHPCMKHCTNESVIDHSILITRLMNPYDVVGPS